MNRGVPFVIQKWLALDQTRDVRAFSLGTWSIVPLRATVSSNFSFTFTAQYRDRPLEHRFQPAMEVFGARRFFAGS